MSFKAFVLQLLTLLYCGSSRCFASNTNNPASQSGYTCTPHWHSLFLSRAKPHFRLHVAGTDAEQFLFAMVKLHRFASPSLELIPGELCRFMASRSTHVSSFERPATCWGSAGSRSGENLGLQHKVNLDLSRVFPRVGGKSKQSYSLLYCTHFADLGEI